jgi:hypothetical protein
MGGSNFVILPQKMIFDRCLSDGALRLYCLLLTYSSRLDMEVGVWPSRQTLATKMGRSLRQVGTYFRELVRAGYVTTERHGHRQTTRHLLGENDD